MPGNGRCFLHRQHGHRGRRRINATDSLVFVTGTTISANQAGGNGGGIVSSPGGTTTSWSLADSTVSGNRAGARGVGIYDDGTEATVTLTKSSLARNKPDNCEPSGSITGCTR